MNQVSKLKRFIGIFIDWIVACIPLLILRMFDLPILFLIGYPISLVIYLLRDALFGGQSIGKKVMGYRAVNADGSSLAGDYKTSAIRNVSLMIPFVDAIMVLTDKPRLGDGWANTKVINA